MIAQGQYELLQRAIFAHPGRSVYAVLDGAIVDNLPARLNRHAPDAMCLFSGQLDPMLEAAAPYMMELRADTDIAQMALREGWNEHWGIVLVVDPGTDAYALRSHLRRNLRVTSPGGEPMLFRFYDPRAFRTVVPMLDADQRKAFFGPIQGCYIESRSRIRPCVHARCPPENTPRSVPWRVARPTFMLAIKRKQMERWARSSFETTRGFLGRHVKEWRHCRSTAWTRTRRDIAYCRKAA